MRLGFTSRDRVYLARWTLTVSMALLWLVVVNLSASPDLHCLLHNDAQSTSHECALTLISKGQLLTELLSVEEAPMGGHLMERIDFPETFPALPLDYRLAPGRAPPGIAS